NWFDARMECLQLIRSPENLLKFTHKINEKLSEKKSASGKGLVQKV
ncbi:MAG: hypothetical protein AB198_01370, partial [Parcubacteria bacterium C7867-003]